MKALKTIAKVVGGIVALAALAAGALWWLGGRRWQESHPIEVAPVAVPADAAALERGRHLAIVHCANCHGEDLGGAMFVEDAAFATVAAPNLTTGEGGVAARYQPLDWVRALRHGLGADGRALFVMPAEIYTHLSDEDLGALVAFLESSPPVDRRWPATKPGLVGRMLRAAGKLDAAFPYTYVDHAAARPPAPAYAATAEYGDYVARTFGCRVCHGQELAGGMLPEDPTIVGPNLTPGGPLAAWNEELFLEMIRSRQSVHMPWRGLRAMDETEQRALWRYLASLPARPSAVAAAPAAAGG
jgi:mono/diheme cytochrome c family protein